MRLVLDTNVVVAAMRSPAGASAGLLRMARSGHVALLMNVPLVMEYEAVCHRPEHEEASSLTSAEVAIYLDAVAAMGEPVDSHFLWRPRLRDPDDEMVLEAAVNGGADAIVSFNVKDFIEVAGQFGVAVWTPTEAFEKLRS